MLKVSLNPKKSYYAIIINMNLFDDVESSLAHALILLERHIKIFYWIIEYEKHIIIITESNYDLPLNIEELAVLSRAIKVKIKCMGRELLRQLYSCLRDVCLK